MYYRPKEVIMKIIKTVFKPICAVLSAVALFISAIPGLFAGTGRAVFTVDASVSPMIVY